VEDAYERYWREFEAAFWETEISVGRLRYPRSSIFLNHWLVARTGEEIVAREVFTRFKRYAVESGNSMIALLADVARAAQVYKSFVSSGSNSGGPIDRLGLFGYRTSILESEVVKPLVMYLLDPQEPKVPDDELMRALDAVESWMVRRMLVRATTKAYNQLIAELIAHLKDGKRGSAGVAVQAFLAGQSGTSRYWPDDDEIRNELRALPAYRRLGRGRLRMVLEAIEDHLRGWRAGKSGLASERVPRGKLAIEHVMPRKWALHWPLPQGSRGESERDQLIHTLGNLTLLTGKLNSNSFSKSGRPPRVIGRVSLRKKLFTNTRSIYPIFSAQAGWYRGPRCSPAARSSSVVSQPFCQTGDWMSPGSCTRRRPRRPKL
jgi:hypothetical protein